MPPIVPPVPLVGHDALRDRLRSAVARDALPASLLLIGRQGIGKQRLALWLGSLLLCSAGDIGARPCGRCEQCRFTNALAHPDLVWFFPRPRLSDADASVDDVLDDYATALAERREAGLLYPPPSGSDAIYLAAVRALVRLAARTPALARRKVFVIGDAERMVPQEGADAAANAFLKLLEEPPDDTTVILTSSEAGSLLPTIRSRVVVVRVPPLDAAAVRTLLGHDAVARMLDAAGVPGDPETRARLADGAPGALLGTSTRRDALAAARALLDAGDGTADRADALRSVASLGGSRARGFFSDVLDALTALLAARARDALTRGDAGAALRASRAVDIVEDAKIRAGGNVSPQLLGAWVVRRVAERLA